MQDGVVPYAVRKRTERSFTQLGQFVTDFAPDLVIQFSPDHFNGFFYDLMPAFCIGTAARSLGDWDTAEATLPVPEEEARSLADYVVAAGIDTAVSYRMNVDHGFVQIWEETIGRSDMFPIIPIFVNAAAPPLPTYARARALGEAVGSWAAKSGKRVMFAASGGLSHDPPTPDIRIAPPEVRERLIAGRNPSQEARASHKQRVLAAGEAAANGEGPCQPLSPEWDRRIIDMFLQGDMVAFDALTTDEVRADGGRGGNEILSWVAAFAALSASGPLQVRLDHYEAIDGWIAGMAMMSATVGQ
jgi:2,3-dihydroxyphenylpropionate 1,2-dioxygenase